MTPCVMCSKEFEEKDVDFLGRCTPGENSCFRAYVQADKKPVLRIPFVPIYNGGR